MTHNPWNYVYYLTHVKETNSSEFNGIESYIYEKWQEEDLSWFPIGRALDLKEEGEEEENSGLFHIWKSFLERHGEEKIIGDEHDFLLRDK